jgi:hypothetical protein
MMDGNKDPHLERNVVNWAACSGHIYVLAWAQDQGWYGEEAELCMWAALSKWSLACVAMAVRGWSNLTWDSRVISCAEECG